MGVEDDVAGVACLSGTDLDVSWLRTRIRELTRPPLVVSVREHRIQEARVLEVRVPRNPGGEPYAVTVSKSGGSRRPRRIGTQCHDMETVAELFAWVEERRGYDWSSAPSGATLADARSVALEVVRDYLREGDRADRRVLADLDDGDLLRHLGLLRGDGSTLTRGGARLLCPSAEPGLLYLAKGAGTELRIDARDRGLIEELRDVERAIAARNRVIELPLRGLVLPRVHALSPRAIREALVNAVVHRDHGVGEPVVVEQTADGLVVSSPGDLYPGLSVDRLLTAQPRTRNRSLAETFRSIGLAEREGSGIGLMHTEQVRVGHRPPIIRERAGGLTVTLVGGEPVPPVIDLFASLPPALASSARTAILVDRLRRLPSLTLRELAEAAQDEEEPVAGFLAEAERIGLVQRLARARAGGETAWRFGDDVRAALGDVLPYRSRPVEESVRLVVSMARFNGRVRNQDVQDALGLTAARASQVLKEAVALGELRLGPGSAARGRSVWYTTVEATTGDGE